MEIKAAWYHGAQTKRPTGQNVPAKKRPTGQNVPRDKMSYTNYQVFYNTFCVRKFATYVAVDNGLHLCTQFMIGVFLFWGG